MLFLGRVIRQIALEVVVHNLELSGGSHQWEAQSLSLLQFYLFSLLVGQRAASKCYALLDLRLVLLLDQLQEVLFSFVVVLLGLHLNDQLFLRPLDVAHLINVAEVAATDLVKYFVPALEQQLLGFVVRGAAFDVVFLLFVVLWFVLFLL